MFLFESRLYLIQEFLLLSLVIFLFIFLNRGVGSVPLSLYCDNKCAE